MYEATAETNEHGLREIAAYFKHYQDYFRDINIMRWYRTLLLSANVVCLLIISSWYFEFNPKPYILPRQSILLNRNELRLIKLYEKYKLLLNLTAFKGNHLAEKTMIYSCQSFCGGWGDRLRGIISVYVLALLTDRRFLMDMNYPWRYIESIGTEFCQLDVYQISDIEKIERN